MMNERIELNPPMPWHDDWDDETDKYTEGFYERVVPGMLLWIEGRDEPILIGTTNRNLGVCDCCRLDKISSCDVKVVAYQIVWEAGTAAKVDSCAKAGG